MKIRTNGRFLTATLSLAALVSPAGAHEPKWHPHEAPSLAPNFGASVAVMALWLPGSGAAFEPRMQEPAAGVLDFVGQPGDQRSIADFERYPSGTSTYFALVYSPIERAEKLLPEVEQLEAGLTGDDGTWHLADFETFVAGSGRRWAGLYHSGVRSQDFAPNLSGSGLKSRVEETEPTDLQHHLVDFEIWMGPSGVRYAALFDDQDKEQQFFPSLTAEAFHTRVHELHGSYRLEDVEVWQTPEGSPRIAALFAKTGSSDHLWALACTENCIKPALVEDYASELQAKTVELAGGSLRLADLEMPLGQLVEPPSGLKSNEPAAPKAKRAKKAKQRPTGPGGLTSVPPPPTGTHALLLHDAGTDGPP